RQVPGEASQAPVKRGLFPCWVRLSPRPIFIQEVWCMKTRSRSIAGAAFLAFALATGASASGPYQITGTVETHDGPLVRTELTVQAGVHPLDRFKAIHLA